MLWVTLSWNKTNYDPDLKFSFGSRSKRANNLGSGSSKLFIALRTASYQYHLIPNVDILSYTDSAELPYLSHWSWYWIIWYEH
jgi:hypothetical protein